MITSFESRVSISPDVMIRQVGSESVLLDLKTERYLGFDELATCMWRVLCSSESVEAAYQNLLTEFEVEPRLLREDVDEFVQELLQYGLIELGK